MIAAQTQQTKTHVDENNDDFDDDCDQEDEESEISKEVESSTQVDNANLNQAATHQVQFTEIFKHQHRMARDLSIESMIPRKSLFKKS